ncbi:interferon-induced transmembrane protein [Promicromonospora sp. AC04]|uniref:septum formation family protein n=1 Tax=Promicromonospora sp. AC04 TaxID=2135723 RepID=UPI000D39BC80|nr:septum formation family protein [Promicromonospora sp. AC04]PUB29907.1 interferon-induced transmembrane protein [Promicromonospora sp. AC04]
MADTKQTPADATEPVATEPETAAEAAPEEPTSTEPAPDKTADEESAEDSAEEAPDEQDSAEEDAAKDAATKEDPAVSGDSADKSALPYPTRVGWVVAAFLLCWPLAIPALVLSMRTAEANGTGNVRRAKKSSVRTLDFSLGAVTLGVLGIVGLAIGIAAAPTYASSLPPGFVSAARSFVPPALAGPLGITLPDDGSELTAPTSSPTPADDPYATADPYADPSTDPYAEDPADGSVPTPEADGQLEPAEEPDPTSDTAATAGAEIPDLEVGDCIDTTATSGQTTLYRIPVVSCTTAHGGEIYAETTASDSLAQDGAAPTQQALWDAADAYCYPEFAKFVGMRWANSELLYWPIAPSEESWAEGDRRVLCVIESEEPVTGSLEGAER